MNIPFTTELFFNVIENYNLSVFPAQIFISILALASVFLIHSKSRWKNKLIGGYLALLWIWIGIVYHLIFFTSINQAAYLFGAFFILQGVLFLFETIGRENLQFEFKRETSNVFAYFFIIFGIIIYPILLYFLEGSLNKTITLGLPCPSTILTFGFLMLTSKKFPKYLLIIPLLWTFVGTSAAFNFGVYPDYMMPLSAIIAIIYLVKRKSNRS